MSPQRDPRLSLALAAIGLGLAFVLLALELALRLLPVCTLLPSLAVNEANPALRYEPNQDGVWSQGAAMRYAVRYRVNNFGFVNDQNYRTADPRPLVAVIGDSFVEALMVPPEETFHALLAQQLSGRARVYSFSRSGVALSQYLAYADWARQLFHPHRLIINVVGNDFDESFTRYKDGPGLYSFPESTAGGPALTRKDYAPGPLSHLAQHSHLMMYLLANLHAHLLPQTIARLFHPPRPEEYAENTRREADADRMAHGDLALTLFLKLLPELSGLPREHILLVVDGNRSDIYTKPPAGTPRSYAQTMLEALAQRARALGFPVVELEQAFAQDYARRHLPFEVPGDGHWSGLGHKVVADAILASGFFDPYLAETASGTARRPAQ